MAVDTPLFRTLVKLAHKNTDLERRLTLAKLTAWCLAIMWAATIGVWIATS